MRTIGPFTFKWDVDPSPITINDVESIELTHEIESSTVSLLDHRVLEFSGAFTFNAVIQLAVSDIPIIAALLPQFHVPYQGILSTGEIVTDEDGAIDVVPGSCEDVLHGHLTITSCGDPGNVFRGVNCRTVPESVAIDANRQIISIKFIGEAEANQATIQLFRDGGIAIVS